VAAAVTAIPDFPKPGILFRDMMPILQNGALLRDVVGLFARLFENENIAYVVGIESRGFILGVPLAYVLGAGFVPVRKKGKLPGAVLRQRYALEYGEDTVEMHAEAIPTGARVLLIDDLLATGGTAEAALTLLGQRQAHMVAVAFLMELQGLAGRAKVAAHHVPVVSAIQYP
jgi:adenine phosphoribosyltransferase